MTRHRWAAAVPPDELGVVVHGPVLLARSPGIAAGLRCVYAHPGGLRLPLVLRAAGVQAEAAGRTTSPRFRDDAGDREPWSGPTLDVEVDGIRGVADAATRSRRALRTTSPSRAPSGSTGSPATAGSG